MDDIYAWTSNGRRLHVDLADERAHALVAADGDLNPRSSILWQRALSAWPWELVVDVGVNYGEMLVGVDLPSGARLVGFEPNPVVRSLAARTFADNGLDVDLRAEAVGATPGVASFAVDPHWSGLSSLAPVGDAAMTVPVTTLDEVVPGAGSWCAKVDVEGFEADVLAGADASLRRDSAWALMLEVMHMPPGLLAGLAAEHHVVMLTSDSSALREVDADDVDRTIESGALYAQDALLVSGQVMASLLG